MPIKKCDVHRKAGNRLCSTLNVYNIELINIFIYSVRYGFKYGKSSLFMAGLHFPLLAISECCAWYELGLAMILVVGSDLAVNLSLQ